ncbi:MAG TPA: 3-phosphoserine/phosphohydroxythreonine transaminase [Noviherbaspirillum sp.]|uniref:3-phosphoserine/phosphohydroxythreonine transaminase n=1 Tax=Noviherbaspirillum sp. TaxID=1926288 RepID=UPI002B464C9A|nr:3-phosphoserine/phosphohydroxythreonine transaminase [Noviherbaspirillum sp.]HJV84201.1 3-phosphoserine/phosphohydroxythreonine transaminase [Noviherbaspirillum sp.]
MSSPSAVWNFASGPARLPDAVLARAGDVLFRRGADGATAIERPFTGTAVRAVLESARERLTQLLEIPANYRVLFLAGGAMQQFSAVPLNLLDPDSDLRTAAYADSGYWSRRAMQEAARFAEVSVIARHDGREALAAPAVGKWHVPTGCAYCHITANETVDGLAYPAWPDTGEVPLVADVTSCFLSAPLDISRFGLLYASAQKNIGPSGMTVVIVREDLLRRPAQSAPSPLCYRLQAEQDGCINTPPVMAIHLAALVFEWIAELGGLSAMAETNRRKAALLYQAIDSSDGFYTAPILVAHRSMTNVRFHLADDSLTERFLIDAEQAGLTNLRGHRHVGGLRASLYNAMPLAGVGALIDFMKEFRQSNG